jgi:hypothetical protein
MLKFLSSILCTYRIQPYSLRNYLRTSLIIGNLMIIRVISVEWTWLGYLKSKGDYDFGMHLHMLLALPKLVSLVIF